MPASRAVNRGVQQARGEWLALVNSDVEADPTGWKN
jgi:hypothetical protein